MKVPFVFLFLTLTLLASADDAAISYGGTPKLMTGHPTIRMVSEHIKITIGETTTRVDCNFVFENDGAACKVRMGFPNGGYGAEETAYSEEVYEAKEKKKPLAPYNGFTSFQSWVDGKKSSVHLTGVKDMATSWYTKTVAFAKGQRRVVRDVYTLRNGMAVTNSNATIEQFHYVMSTGASWKGPIGRAQIDVTFDRKTMAYTPKPVALNVSHDGFLGRKDLLSQDKKNVYFTGFSNATVRGRTLTFVARNLEPKAKDDIWLYFALTHGQTN